MFISEYLKLLIIQYADKPKAVGHITVFLSEFEKLYNVMNKLGDAFDLDLAGGKQLDIIGKIVGIGRVVPFAIPKKYFGFSDNPNSFGFYDKFGAAVSAPFYDKFSNKYSDTELDDTQYRFFIRAKIAKNYSSSKMMDPSRLGVQNAVDFLFGNKAYITDNKDMSMSVYIYDSFDFTVLQYIKQLDAIPRPQGVKVRDYISYAPNGTFGFLDNQNSFGFSDKFGTPNGARFANKII